MFLARCRRVGDGGLLVEIQAEQLHQAVEGGIDSKAFTGDGDEDVGGDGDPDLGFDGVFGAAVEGLDAQVLFDPFEEQFDAPAAALELGDGQGGQCEVVAEKREWLDVERFAVADTARGRGKVVARGDAVEVDELVLEQTGDGGDGS